MKFSSDNRMEGVLRSPTAVSPRASDGELSTAAVRDLSAHEELSEPDEYNAPVPSTLSSTSCRCHTFGIRTSLVDAARLLTALQQGREPQLPHSSVSVLEFIFVLVQTWRRDNCKF